ncbi:uncharacterized protein J3R85_007731 [Psidium guajava]|nr:uncharacterized protein J3R85_007731 [Psidium guajava]
MITSAGSYGAGLQACDERSSESKPFFYFHFRTALIRPKTLLIFSLDRTRVLLHHSVEIFGLKKECLAGQSQNLTALCQQRERRTGRNKHACSSVSCLGLPLLLRRSCSRGFVLVRRRRDHKEESEVDVPPGSVGLPLIGETLQFMAAINSGRGFYGFGRAVACGMEDASGPISLERPMFSSRLPPYCAHPITAQAYPWTSEQLFLYMLSISVHPTIDELIVKSLLDWEHRGTVVVLDEALKITFEIMCRMLLSLEGGRQLEMLQEDVGIVCKAMLAFPLRLPRTRFQRGLQARERIMSTLETLIAQRRCSGTSHEDCLQRLLSNDDETECEKGPKLSIGEIKDNILTMIIAGHDTTASAITWMVKYLGENETVLDKLRVSDLTALLEFFSSSESILNDDRHLYWHCGVNLQGAFWLSRLNKYASRRKCGKAISQTGRHRRDVVCCQGRQGILEDGIGSAMVTEAGASGLQYRKGIESREDGASMSMQNLYILILWFMPTPSSSIPPDSTFRRWGKTCLGMNMAKAMMLVFLHRLVTTYKWRVLDPDSTLEKWALFSRLKNGCPVLVTRLAEETTGP